MEGQTAKQKLRFKKKKHIHVRVDKASVVIHLSRLIGQQSTDIKNLTCASRIPRTTRNVELLSNLSAPPRHPSPHHCVLKGVFHLPLKLMSLFSILNMQSVFLKTNRVDSIWQGGKGAATLNRAELPVKRQRRGKKWNKKKTSAPVLWRPEPPQRAPKLQRGPPNGMPFALLAKWMSLPDTLVCRTRTRTHTDPCDICIKPLRCVAPSFNLCLTLCNRFGSPTHKHKHTSTVRLLHYLSRFFKSFFLSLALRH